MKAELGCLCMSLRKEGKCTDTQAALPNREHMNEQTRGGIRGCYPTAAEGGRERESVCVWMQEGIWSKAYGFSLSWACVAPTAWLQVCNRCELEVRGGGHMKVKWGKEQLYFLCLAKARQGGIYTWQVCYMQGSDLDRKDNQGCINEYNDAIYSKGEFGDAWSRMRCRTMCMACIDR